MIADDLRMIKESFLALLFPPLCSFCDSMGAPRASAICPSCRDALKPVPSPVCSRCGLPFAGLSGGLTDSCGRCLTDPPPYTRARYGFVYADGLREGIVRFKYAGRLYLSVALGNLLIDAFMRYFSVSDFDLIVPVPIHRKRLVARGFNQALVIAERLADATGIPMDRSCFVKIRDTPPQVGLPRADRLKNLKGSFGVGRRSSIIRRRVLVIDDVATTGSTITEATKTLLEAGAAQADALALALRSQSAEGLTNEMNQGGNARWL
jgi:ComF family protein